MEWPSLYWTEIYNFERGNFAKQFWKKRKKSQNGLEGLQKGAAIMKMLKQAH